MAAFQKMNTNNKMIINQFKIKNYPCRSRGSVHSNYILSFPYFSVKGKTLLRQLDAVRVYLISHIVFKSFKKRAKIK